MEEELKNEELKKDENNENVEEVVLPTIESSAKNTETPKEENKELTSFKLLFKKSFSFYKNNFKKILGIFFIPNLVALLLIIVIFPLLFATFVLSIMSGNFIPIIISLLFLLPLILVFVMLNALSFHALISFVRDAENLKEKSAFSILKSSLKTLTRFFWGYFVVSLLVGLGFVLFIIPGLIFLTLYSFAWIIYIEEKVSIKKALKKSREYVRGIEYKVFSRLSFLLILGILTQILVNKIFLGQIFVILLISPISTLYFYYLYQEVKRIKGNI